MLPAGSYILQAYPEKVFLDLIRRLLPSSTLSSPNLLLVKGEASIGIDAIRQIRRFLALKHWQMGYRIVAIENGNLLTLPAQNAFLKTLEEPGRDTFIFIRLPDKNLYHLLPTIRSRCQILAPARSPKSELLAGWQEFFAAPPPGKQKLWQEWQKEQPPEQILDRLLQAGQQQLLHSPGSALPRLRQQILLLLEAKKMLAANLKPEEVFDWLAINM